MFEKQKKEIIHLSVQFIFKDILNVCNRISIFCHCPVLFTYFDIINEFTLRYREMGLIEILKMQTH